MLTDPKFKQYDVVYYTKEGIKDFPKMGFSTPYKLFELNRPYVINSISLCNEEWRVQVDGAAATIPERYFTPYNIERIQIEEIKNRITTCLEKYKVYPERKNNPQYVDGYIKSLKDTLNLINELTTPSQPIYPCSVEEMKRILDNLISKLSPSEVQAIEYELNNLDKLYPNKIEKLDILPETKDITVLIQLDSVLEMKIKQLIANDYAFMFVEGHINSIPSDNSKNIYIYSNCSPAIIKKSIEQRWDELYNRAYVEEFKKTIEKLTNQ